MVDKYKTLGYNQDNKTKEKQIPKNSNPVIKETNQKGK